MTKSRTYGGTIEIKSFSDLYKVLVQVVVNGIIHDFKPNSINGTLKLKFSGPMNAGHYNIIEFQNSHFVEMYKSTIVSTNCSKNHA